jgi:hypothetical protein
MKDLNKQQLINEICKLRPDNATRTNINNLNRLTKNSLVALIIHFNKNQPIMIVS